VSDYVDAIKDSMNPQRWVASALTLMFLASPLFVELFLLVQDLPSPHAAGASYAVLFLWAFVLFSLFAWSRGPSTIDVAKRFLLRSGWHVRDVLPQGIAGSGIVFLLIAPWWLMLNPGLRAFTWPDVLPKILFTWVIAAPVETLLQAWVWPIAFPFGPITAQLVFVALHGERALDPAFAIVAFLLGSAFFLLCFLRYVLPGASAREGDPVRGSARFFGPIAASSGHATWNTLLMLVALELPSLSVLEVSPWSLVLVLVLVSAVIATALRARGRRRREA
jgi:hypothetical protein